MPVAANILPTERKPEKANPPPIIANIPAITVIRSAVKGSFGVVASN